MTNGPSRATGRSQPAVASRSAGSEPQQPPVEPPSSATFPSDEPPDSSTENGRKAALDKLNSFISEYRERKTSKSKALFGILDVLSRDTTSSDIEKEKAVELYVEEINSVNHGDRIRTHRSPSREPPDDINRSVHELLDKVSSHAKSRCEFSESEANDIDEPPSKRKKVNESEMPWYKPDEVSSSRNINNLETCKSLRIFNRDIAGCKFWVKIAEGAPPGIPSPQWERIFRGEPVELDHFLSSLHRTSINEEGETRIGNAKISLGISDAKRRISTASEWSAAWNFAARAISFVFPHRIDELRAYGDYIEGEFAAKLTSSHPKVILFDIAVRNVVQGGQSILLTDQHRFLRLYSAILMPDGVESFSGKSANRRSNPTRASGSKSDICNRFNNSNGCKSSESDCRYRHICKNCKKGGHGKEQCTN
jgi:hypothetical protein